MPASKRQALAADRRLLEDEVVLSVQCGSHREGWSGRVLGKTLLKMVETHGTKMNIRTNSGLWVLVFERVLVVFNFMYLNKSQLYVAEKNWSCMTRPIMKKMPNEAQLLDAVAKEVQQGRCATLIFFLDVEVFHISFHCGQREVFISFP